MSRSSVWSSDLLCGGGTALDEGDVSPDPTGRPWERRQQAMCTQMHKITPHCDMCPGGKQSRARGGKVERSVWFSLFYNSSGCTGKPWEELVIGWHLSRDLNDNRKVTGRIKIRTKISFDTLSTWDIWAINMSTKIISSSVKNYITVLSEKNREMSRRRPYHDNNKNNNNNNNDTISWVLCWVITKKKYSIKLVTLWLYNIAKYFQTEWSSSIIYVALFILRAFGNSESWKPSFPLWLTPFIQTYSSEAP